MSRLPALEELAEQARELLRNGDMVAYWARPTVTCSCGLAFSERVARLHRDRAGHPAIRRTKGEAQA